MHDDVLHECVRREYRYPLLLLDGNDRSAGGCRCWWCSDTFTGQVYSVPQRLEGGTWHVHSAFCSLSCAKSSWLRGKALLALLLRKMGMDLRQVPPAPSPEVLQEFGGPLSREEYRRRLCKPAWDAQAKRLSIRHMQEVLEVHERVKLHRTQWVRGSLLDYMQPAGALRCHARGTRPRRG